MSSREEHGRAQHGRKTDTHPQHGRMQHGRLQHGPLQHGPLQHGRPQHGLQNGRQSHGSHKLSRGRLFFTTVSLITVLLLVSGTLLAASERDSQDADDSPYKYLSVFMEVFGLASKAYVDESEVGGLMDGALEGTFDALDPFSQFIPPEAVDSHRAVRQRGNQRTGMTLLKERGVVYAIAVEESSPAAEAGLERGDILVTVGGLSTRDAPFYRLEEVLSGDVGATLEIERLRQGEKDTVELKLADYERPPVVLEAEQGVAVLRIPSFHEGVASRVESSLEALAAADPSLEDITEKGKLVLDIRGVAGGVEAEAYATAGLFTRGALGVLERRGEALETFTDDDPPVWSGRVVVLTDSGTQGPAEIVAAVLDQTIEATLVGEPTFGHSGRLSSVNLKDGGILEITGAFFTGPDAEPLTESIEPDIPYRAVVFVDEEGRSRDPLLERGLAVLLEDEAEPEAKLAA